MAPKWLGKIQVPYGKVTSGVKARRRECRVKRGTVNNCQRGKDLKVYIGDSFSRITHNSP